MYLFSKVPLSRGEKPVQSSALQPPCPRLKHPIHPRSNDKQTGDCAWHIHLLLLSNRPAPCAMCSGCMVRGCNGLGGSSQAGGKRQANLLEQLIVTGSQRRAKMKFAPCMGKQCKRSCSRHIQSTDVIAPALQRDSGFVNVSRLLGCEHVCQS